MKHPAQPATADSRPHSGSDSRPDSGLWGSGEALMSGRLRDVALVAAYLGAVKAASTAAIEVPGSPVPVSAQSLAVIGGSIALGPRRAIAGSLAHAALATADVDGFAPSRPAARGYVGGFLVAGPTVGLLAARGRAHGPTIMGVAALGHGIILAAGATHLHRHDPGRIWERGIRPFLPGAVIKSAIIALVTPVVRRLGTR